MVSINKQIISNKNNDKTYIYGKIVIPCDITNVSMVFYETLICIFCKVQIGFP